MRNGYFVHFISPTEVKSIAKNIMFVIDESGSMSGRRMENTKKEMGILILKSMNEIIVPSSKFFSQKHCHNICLGVCG